ncbi:MAG: hypothetical protein ACK5OO_05675, partial [Cyclobacteriaceae bacterium]
PLRATFKIFSPYFFLFDSKHSMRTASIQNHSLRNTPSTHLKLTTMVNNTGKGEKKHHWPGAALQPGAFR